MTVWFLSKTCALHTPGLHTVPMPHRGLSHRTVTDPWTVGNLSVLEESEVKAAEFANVNEVRCMTGELRPVNDCFLVLPS